MIQKVTVPTCNPTLLGSPAFIKGVGKWGGGAGGGGGGAKAPLIYGYKNKGKKKDPTNKKGYPSQTLPY